MPVHLSRPTEIKAHGNIPKVIKEFIGRVNSKTAQLSIAKMESPSGWQEPGQTPEFDEYTIVLKGALQVETKAKTFQVKAGEAFIAQKGEWVKYSTPDKGGAEYIAVCQPAFSPDLVRRDKI